MLRTYDGAKICEEVLSSVNIVLVYIEMKQGLF